MPVCLSSDLPLPHVVIYFHRDIVSFQTHAQSSFEMIGVEYFASLTIRVYIFVGLTSIYKKLVRFYALVHIFIEVKHFIVFKDNE